MTTRVSPGGLANAGIARKLGIGERTVETHLSRAYAELGVRRRQDLVRQTVDQCALTARIRPTTLVSNSTERFK